MKLYRVIYADPPWSFATWSHRGQGKGASRHYACMSVEDICTLRIEGRHVNELAEPDAALFLWVTQPMLPEALRVIDAWGFEFKTVAFLWVKMPAAWTADVQGSFLEPRLRPRLGLGYHTRSGSEQCWLATRGKGYERVTQGVEQVLHAPVRQHSRKPDEIAERIVALTGDVSRIELFARAARRGWDTWGDETKKFTASEPDIFRNPPWASEPAEMRDPYCGSEPYEKRNP
jgi:N6-adenosine-specific RNA methylase IME4